MVSCNSVDSEASGLFRFTPIDQGSSTKEAKTLICIDTNKMKISWIKNLSDTQEVNYRFSKFWIIGLEATIMDENGDIVAEKTLQSAWNDYEARRYQLEENASFFTNIFPIEQNQAILTTSNGFIYRWTLGEEKNEP